MAVVVNDRVRGQWMKFQSVGVRSRRNHDGSSTIVLTFRSILLIAPTTSTEKSARPIRQLSLQPPAPRRRQVRRQRSAEDDKLLQICASPFARGKRGTSAKPGSERPKVRLAWKEDRQKNEKELEQVEVVARQIPGRSRPSTQRSRAFVTIDKPSILYSRQELAERLRLAWKHRQETRANINIFLTRTFDERCNSATSNYSTISGPPSPIHGHDDSKCETDSIDACKRTGNEQCQGSTIFKRVERNDNGITLEKNGEELSIDFQRLSTEMGRIVEPRVHEVSTNANTDRGKSEVEKEHLSERTSLKSNNGGCPTSNKKTSPIIDYSNSRLPPATLPSIKVENPGQGVAKLSKEDFSSAKQKRASFQSGTNRAFLDPIRSTATECGSNSVSDKVRCSTKLSTDGLVIVEHDTLEPRAVEKQEEKCTTLERNGFVVKYNAVDEKNAAERLTTDGKPILATERQVRCVTITEHRDTLPDSSKIVAIRRTNEAGKCNSWIKGTSSVNSERTGPIVDKGTVARNKSEVRCSSVNERNLSSKKIAESQKMEQKTRRTSSAPPGRHFDSASANNRLQVNIVIDPSAASVGRRKEDKLQDKTNAEYKDNIVERVDAASIKVTSNRTIRSAPLKRRSRSSKRRSWVGCSGKNDEDGKPRNRSAGRPRNSIDSRTMDIVTMVSLVSSADSDSDTDDSPRDDKLIDELRSKLPTTSIIKSSISSALSSARKPAKSVSFQRDSPDEDSPKEQQPLPKEERKTAQPRFAIVNKCTSETNLPRDEATCWRTDTVGLALPILALIRDAEEPVDVPLTDREKRCLAVPIGDLHDKKRKLQKARSTPSRSRAERQMITPKIKIQETPNIIVQKMEIPVQYTRTVAINTSANIKSTVLSTLKDTVEPVQTVSIEPRFQTNKEKECWHLYRKMCDKGVCVSFDTVLRGMLTPTEYRLRQKELW